MSAELIIAMNEKGGIGHNGYLPWLCKEELNVFKQKTLGKTLVVGRKTACSLPKLIDRKIICMTRDVSLNTTEWKNEVTIINSLDSLKDFKDIMIAGGNEIYELALKHPSLVNRVHISIVKGDHECDTYFSFECLKNFVIIEETRFKEFTHYILIRTNELYNENQYLDLLRNILSTGERRDCRNGDTLSLFKSDMKFDLRIGFPLLTSKKMFLRGILEEILFFLRGDTDTTILSEKGIKIWEGNTSENFICSTGLSYAKGVMGPMYGYQWRFFNASYEIDKEGYPLEPRGGVDQLADVVNLIKTDPTSRRILMTSYNPAQSRLGVLYPCHSITIQFYVNDCMLDMFCYNRSQDAFLGVPFNIASSALLLMIVSKLTSKIPRFLYMTMGDTHIYSSHIEQVKTQLKRIPYVFPKLLIPDIQSIEDIKKLEAKDFILSNYQFHPSIKAEMVA